MPRKCVVLLSGGLDSLLVLKLMAMQGMKTLALHSLNCFHGTGRIEEKKQRLRRDALALGAEDIVFPDLTRDVVALTKNPRHGFGKHLNACIDCRLRTIAEGFAVMRQTGADFVVSGEVVGQRPMSQRRDAIALADKIIASWGFPGLFLRPLSAKLLDRTVPEQEGWIDSERLYDISGRGRDRQIALAAEIGVENYPGPAGGCLLTDPGFSRRLALLCKFQPDWSELDVELLKIGRHFVVHPGTRVVASRNEAENYRLRELSTPDDRMYINHRPNGAVVMLRGRKTAEAEAVAAGLAVYYSKMRENGEAEVESWRVDGADIDQAVSTARTVHPDTAREMESVLAGGGILKEMRRTLGAGKCRRQRCACDKASHETV